MSFSIKVKNLEAVKRLAEQFPAAAEKHIEQGIRISFLRVLSNIKQAGGAPVGVYGALRDQWGQTFKRFYGKLESSTPYAPMVEFGTRPHWPPWKSPDFQAWARKRGLNAFLVARSISRKGTKANPFFDRSINDAQPGISEEWKKALDNIVRDIT